MTRLRGRSYAIALFALFAVVVFVDGRLSMELIAFKAGTHDFPVPSLLDAYSRYDSGWYHSIASRGYFYAGPDLQSSVAFFPAYPAAMRLVGLVVGNFVLAGFLVTLASGFAVAALFHRWVTGFLGDGAARFALALFLCYPFAFYLGGAVYSEALFLVAVLGAFVLIERDKPLLAGLAGVIATAARPVGVAVCVLLVLRVLELRGVFPGGRPATLVDARPSAGRPNSIAEVRGHRLALLPQRVDLSALRRVRPTDFGVVLSVLGVVGFMALLAVRFDEPFAFAEVGGAAGWWKGTGWEVFLKIHLFRLLDAFGLNIVTFWLVAQGLFGVVALAAVPAVVRRFGWAYGAYVLVSVGIAFAETRDFIGMGRYVLPALPAFAAVADVVLRWSAGAMGGVRRWLPAVVLGVNATLEVWMVSLFARWYFLS
ncbi:MAG TPA: hypothetical protein VM143_13910 [Acidimicrobiales bacterium]|nr:hypothetical protein [Acidimicrobiales bacterium]